MSSRADTLHLFLGNQQFTFSNLSASRAINAIYGTFNWGMTFKGTIIDS